MTPKKRYMISYEILPAHAKNHENAKVTDVVFLMPHKFFLDPWTLAWVRKKIHRTKFFSLNSRMVYIYEWAGWYRGAAGGRVSLVLRSVEIKKTILLDIRHFLVWSEPSYLVGLVVTVMQKNRTIVATHSKLEMTKKLEASWQLVYRPRLISPTPDIEKLNI